MYLRYEQFRERFFVSARDEQQCGNKDFLEVSEGEAFRFKCESPVTEISIVCFIVKTRTQAEHRQSPDPTCP